MNSLPAPRRDPDATRRHLLDEAAGLAADGGMGAVTLDAVARKAGVSKGGLLHHFPARRALLDALFEDMLDDMDASIAAGLDPDDDAPGRFTRAYLNAIERWSLSPEALRQSAFWVLMLGEPDLRARWSAWIASRIEAHARTDTCAVSRAVRLASDGLWLSDLCEGPDSEAATRQEIVAALRALLAK